MYLSTLGEFIREDCWYQDSRTILVWSRLQNILLKVPDTNTQNTAFILSKLGKKILVTTNPTVRQQAQTS